MSSISSLIGPTTDAIIKLIVKSIKRKKTKDKIMKNIIDPLLCDLSSRYYPYFIMIIVTLLLITILLVCILIITLTNQK